MRYALLLVSLATLALAPAAFASDCKQKSILRIEQPAAIVLTEEVEPVVREIRIQKIQEIRVQRVRAIRQNIVIRQRIRIR